MCEEGGERTVLSGPLSVWYSESTRFGWECDRELTLADRLDQRRVSGAGEVTSAVRPTSPQYR